MKARISMAFITIAALVSAPLSFAADKTGIFETVRVSSVPFDETAAALEAAFAGSEPMLQGAHDVRVPEDKHPEAHINMANPVAHAMVLYAGSSNCAAPVEAAGKAAVEIRQLVAAVPGVHGKHGRSGQYHGFDRRHDQAAALKLGHHLAGTVIPSQGDGLIVPGMYLSLALRGMA